MHRGGRAPPWCKGLAGASAVQSDPSDRRYWALKSWVQRWSFSPPG